MQFKIEKLKNVSLLILCSSYITVVNDKSLNLAIFLVASTIITACTRTHFQAIVTQLGICMSIVVVYINYRLQGILLTSVYPLLIFSILLGYMNARIVSMWAIRVSKLCNDCIQAMQDM